MGKALNNNNNSSKKERKEKKKKERQSQHLGYYHAVAATVHLLKWEPLLLCWGQFGTGLGCRIALTSARDVLFPPTAGSFLCSCRELGSCSFTGFMHCLCCWEPLLVLSNEGGNQTWRAEFKTQVCIRTSIHLDGKLIQLRLQSTASFHEHTLFFFK